MGNYEKAAELRAERLQLQSEFDGTLTIYEDGSYSYDLDDNNADVVMLQIGDPNLKLHINAVFFNDVLPYASLDETREAWRGDFYAKCAKLVKGCKTSTEAAQAINKGPTNWLKPFSGNSSRRSSAASNLPSPMS